MAKPHDDLGESLGVVLARTKKSVKFQSNALRVGVGVGVALSLFACQAFSQQTGVLSAEQAGQEALRRQEERARQSLEAPQTPSELKPTPRRVTPSLIPDDEKPCFVITDIELRGNDAQRFSWLKGEIAAYRGRCIGVRSLSAIAAELNAKLQEFGYVTTRVSLPPQNLSKGTLDLHLSAGRISSIEMVTHGRSGGGDWGTFRNAFPVSTGDILDVHALEQGVEQMKRLPSQRVATQLEPGEDADTTRVLIEREPVVMGDRVRGSVGLDNSGSSTLGRGQLSANFAVDNPLGLNDIMSLSLNSNAEKLQTNHRAQSASLNYSIPWGYNTFTLSGSYSRFAQVVQGTTVYFLSSGNSQSGEVRWDRTMLRTSSSKFGVYAAVSSRRAQSFIDDTELLVQRRRNTQLETGTNWRHLFGQSSVDLNLGYRRGMPWNAAQDDFPTAASGGLTLRPRIWTVSANFDTPLHWFKDVPIRYALNVRGQSTRDQTLSTDQIAIGGRYSVRGFDGDAVLIAESGVIARNEWSTPGRALGDWIGMESAWMLALDLGRVWGSSDVNLIGNKLVGAALGVKARDKNVQLDISLGAPLYKPAGFKTRRFYPYVSLTYAF